MSGPGAEFEKETARVATQTQPTPEQWAALEFAWKVCKHVKSNAIVYAGAGQLLSAGAGQMSRVFSAEIGAKKSVLPLENCAVASDAFFPFPDGLEVVVKNGATSVIQPGGSMRDAEVIAAADERGVAELFVADWRRAHPEDTRTFSLLAGGIKAWMAAGYPVVGSADVPPDAECIDYLFFVHDRHDGNKAAARQYLAWETGLLAQLDDEERGAFRVGESVASK